MNEEEVRQRLRRAAELQEAAELANTNPQNWETRFRLGNDLEEVTYATRLCSFSSKTSTEN